METAFKRPALAAIIHSARKPFPDPPKTLIWLFCNCSKEERAETSISLHPADSKCIHFLPPQHAAIPLMSEGFESTVSGSKLSCQRSGQAGSTFDMYPHIQ